MTLLSSDVNKTKLIALLSKADRESIANFVSQRFTERYIQPINSLGRTEKHGFSIMAVSCLMIESIESFRNGWETTKGRSEYAFKRFLTSQNNFSEFKDYAHEFYSHVRCGILHQSETTNGWKIRREGKIFDAETKTVNASEFLSRLEESLHQYVQQLKEDEWDSEIWGNLKKKLDHIIKNCG